MQNVRLHRPRSKSIGFDSVLNRNRHILMPGNFPIRARNLVKEYSSYREKISSENWFYQFMDGL